ncbi:MAG: P1 family peptidase, partial [Gemmatimonadaceae bacterium]
SDLRRCVASRDSTSFPASPRCTGARSAWAVGAPTTSPHSDRVESHESSQEQGSIIIVVATDAPLLPHQLKRLATRAALGVGRMGGRGENSSGDIFVAFSTANQRTVGDTAVARVAMLPNGRINPLFAATIQATEEAILNALLAAETMTGADDMRVYALPVDRLLAAMRKYNRLP